MKISANFLRSFAAASLATSLAAMPALADELPIMSIAAMTGGAGFAGTPEQNGIRLAFEEANASGFLDGDTIKLIEGDYASDKAQAINLANQAIQRHQVILSLGPTTSPDGIALGYIFNEAKTPMISFATSPEITATGEWVYKMQQSSADTIPELAKYALEKAGVKRVALVYDGANDGLIEAKTLFGNAITAGGGEIVADEAVGSKDTNFLPLVTKLASMEIDAIFFATYAEQGGNIMIQLQQAGLEKTVRYFGSQGISSPKLMEIAGPAAEGTLVTGEFTPGIDSPLNKAFEAAYKARYGSDPDFFAAIGYSAGQVALQAIKAAGPAPDRAKVLAALQAVRDVPVVVGSGLWNHNNRNGSYGVTVLQVKDGKFTLAP